jgi:hypothetical protein
MKLFTRAQFAALPSTVQPVTSCPDGGRGSGSDCLSATGAPSRPAEALFFLQFRDQEIENAMNPKSDIGHSINVNPDHAIRGKKGGATC